MASGDTLIVFTPHHNNPPATQYATLDTIAATGDTPDTVYLVLDFDPGATTEFADFTAVVPGQYDGTSAIEVVLGWTSEATTGNVKWDVAFKSFTDDTDAVTKAWATIQSTTTTTSGTAREVKYTVIDFTNAQADSIQPNEMFALRVERDSADAADTMNSNDAELHTVEVRLN